MGHLEAIVSSIGDEFDMTHTKKIKKFLGIEVTNTSKAIHLHMEEYITKLQKSFDMEKCATTTIPMNPSTSLEPDTQTDRHDPALQYQQLIGALLFITRCVRPDIAFAVHKLSRYFKNYEQKHMKAAKDVLRYLAGTKTLGISYEKKKEVTLVGYSDSDYAGDRVTRRSTTGIVYTFNDSPLTWLSKRQSLVALSSTEAEYVALATASKEGIWLRNLLCDMKVLKWHTSFQLTLNADSQSALKLAENPEFHNRTKHIDVRYHFIRLLVETKQIELQYMPSEELVADTLTKPLAKPAFLKKRKLMNLAEKEVEVEKHKAMRCTIPNKRMRFGLKDAIFIVVAFLQLLTLGICGKFQDGSAIIWRKSTQPAVIGYDSVNAKINLISPCVLLPLGGLSSHVAMKLRRQCVEQYEDLFLRELEIMCPRKNDVNYLRVKRELFVAIGILVIFAIASAGVGMGAYAVHQTDQLELGQMEIERTLDDLEKKVKILSEELKLLQKEIKKMAMTVNKLIMDLNEFREHSIESQFLVSYLTSRLLIGRSVIMETRRLWKRDYLDPSFFEYLNFTLPCGEKCPINYGIPKKCMFDRERESLYLDFAVPVVDEKIKIVEADPFILMVKQKGQTCKIIFDGPKNAMISPDEDCVYAVDLGTDYRGRVLFTPSHSCRNKTLGPNETTLFKMDTCTPSKEGDEKEFVQVKAYDNKFYIYCPGLEYQLEQKRVVKCPNRVFTLPLTVTFKLNNVTYKGQNINLVYNEKEDPLFFDKVEWHLTPTINWDELNKTFPVLEELDKNHWTRHNPEHWGITAFIIGCVLWIMGAVFVGIKIKAKLRKPTKPKRRNRSKKNKQRNANMELKQVKEESTTVTKTVEESESSDISFSG